MRPWRRSSKNAPTDQSSVSSRALRARLFAGRLDRCFATCSCNRVGLRLDRCSRTLRVDRVGLHTLACMDSRVIISFCKLCLQLLSQLLQYFLPQKAQRHGTCLPASWAMARGCPRATAGQKRYPDPCIYFHARFSRSCTLSHDQNSIIMVG